MRCPAGPAGSTSIDRACSRPRRRGCGARPPTSRSSGTSPTTRPTTRGRRQQRYFDYMRAHNRYAIPVSDGVDPAGWAAGLRRYVDSRYQLTRSGSFDSALRSAVTNLRRTNLPVAITVSHGNHAWVLTGFTATADPAVDHPVQRHERARRRAAVGSPEPELRLRHAARHEAHAGPAEGLLHARGTTPASGWPGRVNGSRSSRWRRRPGRRRRHPDPPPDPPPSRRHDRRHGRRRARRRPRSRARPFSSRRPRALRRSTRWRAWRDRSRARIQSPKRRRQRLPPRPAMVSRRPSWPARPLSLSRSRSWRRAAPGGFANASSRGRR